MSSQSCEKIKVFARIRPSKEEKVKKVVQIVGNNKITINLGDDPKLFEFDGVFGEDSIQEEVFDGAASRIVHGTLQGYNGTIFAYGQTGSGKTHTMIGPSGKLDMRSGIIPRGLHLLFDLLDKKTQEMPDRFSAKISISFIEIYNENICDLLEMKDEKLTIGQDRDGNVMVKGVTEFVVKNLNDAMEQVMLGWKNRNVAETAMNRASSRSHALLLIKIHTEEVHGNVDEEGAISTARFASLNLVDLAGSERASDKVEKTLLKETANINKSLLFLKQVIRELSQLNTKTFPAFRNSMLTHILKDSLGGNARTAVIINLHPDKKYYSETLSTLKFSAEVRTIENKVVVNEDLKGDSVVAFKAEIKRLQDEMEMMQNKSADELAEMKKRKEAWMEAANKFERQLAVAKRNALNVAIVARKDGQEASLSENIWNKTMIEVAELARTLPITNIRSVKLRELREELELATFEKDELIEQMGELQKRLKRALEGRMSSFGEKRPRAKLDTHGEDGETDNDPLPIDNTDEVEKEELEIKNSQLENLIAEKEQEVELLNGLLKMAETNMSQVQENLTNALESRKDEEKKMKELKANLERAEKTIGEERKKVKDLAKQKSEMQDQLIEAAGQKDRLNSDIKLMQSTHADELKELKENLMSHLSDKEKKEVDLKTDIDRLKGEIESTKVELTKKETEKEVADDDLFSMRDRLRTVEEERSAQKIEMEELRVLMENERRKMKEERKKSEKSHKATVAELKKEIKKNKEQLEKERRKREQIEAKSEAELERLQEELANFRIGEDNEMINDNGMLNDDDGEEEEEEDIHSGVEQSDEDVEPEETVRSGKCQTSNFTVIQKRDGPIRRLKDEKTTPKCVLCEKRPPTIIGYTEHLCKKHGSTLRENGIYIKCGCGHEIRCRDSDQQKEHKKKCDGRKFQIHKLDDK